MCDDTGLVIRYAVFLISSKAQKSNQWIFVKWIKRGLEKEGMADLDEYIISTKLTNKCMKDIAHLHLCTKGITFHNLIKVGMTKKQDFTIWWDFY